MKIAQFVLPLLALVAFAESYEYHAEHATSTYNSALCKFPFAYNEHWYSACTHTGYEAYWCSRSTYYEGHWAVCHKITTGLNYVSTSMLPSNYQGHIQTYSQGGAGIWWSTEAGTFRYDADKDTAVHDGGYLTHISVGGNQVWGVNSANQIWRLTRSGEGYSSWAHIGGEFGLMDVSVSPNNHVWGVSSGHAIYRYGLTGGEGEERHWGFQHVAGALKQISSGPSGVWGVNRNDMIYYRSGTQGDNGAMGEGWIMIPGRLSYVVSGTGWIYGVNSAGVVWKRSVPSENPTEGHWYRLPGQMSEVGVYGATAWGIQSQRVYNVYTAHTTHSE